jgi:hypothetical protein
MASKTMPVSDTLRKGEGPDGLRRLLHELMAAEVGAQIGVERYVPTAGRTA